MQTDRSLMAESEDGHRNVPRPILAIAGMFLGLGYIIVFPFIGLISFILLGGYRAKQSLASMGRRATRATFDPQEGAKTEAVGVSDFLQPLIDGLECELVVIDRELRITQYYTPLLRQNKLLEQTAIGKHCFEVSHGRNNSCESCEHECPVRKVLETNEKVTATHYHENQLEGKGRQRPVKVLALPVRDSLGNITQVAELIWDVDNDEIVPGMGNL